MADFVVRDLDDEVAEVLQARADRRGVPIEEEVRRTLTASVIAQQQEYVRRLQALKAAVGGSEGNGAGSEADRP